MTTEQEAMLQAIYDKINKPIGMFMMELSTNNVVTELSNTYIDYTKLSLNNFMIKNIPNTSTSQVKDPNGAGDTAVARGSLTYSMSYDSTNGIITKSCKLTGTIYGHSSANTSVNINLPVVLCCDKESCLKSNWKDFV